MTDLLLRPDADGERACDILRDLANEAGNARSGTMFERYVAWTENAERMLGNVVEAEATADLVHTARYWALRTISPETHRLAALVDAELDSRQQAFTRAEGDLRAQRQRWRSKAATLVVVDTNIFLQQDRPIQDVDWLTVADSRPGVRLVVPLVVVYELDRLKRQGNSTTAKMAREAIRWLATTLPSNPAGRSDLLSGQHHRGVTIEVAVQGGLTRPDDADGVIIGFAQQLKVISGMFVKLVTRDLGMQLRARSLGVDALLLDSAPGESADHVARG
jgi:hypothetical protein